MWRNSAHGVLCTRAASSLHLVWGFFISSLLTSLLQVVLALVHQVWQNLFTQFIAIAKEYLDSNGDSWIITNSTCKYFGFAIVGFKIHDNSIMSIGLKVLLDCLNYLLVCSCDVFVVLLIGLCLTEYGMILNTRRCDLITLHMRSSISRGIFPM
jgi:hypothetical protein